jgi:hypothetical protein
LRPLPVPRTEREGRIQESEVIAPACFESPSTDFSTRFPARKIENSEENPSWNAGSRVKRIVSKKPRPATKHHYLPASFQAGFTDTGTKHGLTWVFDIGRKKIRRQGPSGIGFENDLNRFDSYTQDRDALEKHFAEIDSDGIAVVRDACRNACVPADEDEMALFVVYVALMYARNPFLRRLGSSVAQQLNDFVRTFNPKVQAALERNHGKLPFIPTQNDHVRSMCEFFLTALHLFDARSWRVVRTDNGLICSDTPVSIVKQWPPIMDKLGYLPERDFLGSMESVVYFPLDTNNALFGFMPECGFKFHPSPGLVPMLNAIQLAFTRSYVISRESTFDLLLLGRQITSETLMKIADLQPPAAETGE